jgi:hypothetical protein
MAKKINKAAAEDWQQEQKAAAERDEAMSEQQTALFYGANKRDSSNFPCAETLERLGFAEAASKVRQAYRLLGEAEYSFNKQLNPQEYA